ncbi:MAG: oligopeptide transporter, OPT family [Treponema sp.]|uniref:OPT family oligopeptide transporter n=1 Tax=Treponema sp. TaxID=166 RepID=UPI001D34D7D3|nr:oligopeptide transporter, OPT family [Treponema sp.]MBS7309680.1 oligopeptide transporter, OPT family [Treponema sp.]
MATDNAEFKPYIPANKITTELTVTSIITGIILAIVFGAANAYLGLRVGMTISASIPAAVIAMGVTRIILKKNSILESNMVQTIGSAGESLAAGAIFTMPALFLWAKEGLIEQPSILTISLITVCGGILGVLFMIPLRNSIIVQEHGTLPYPEAQACAEVLLAGEEKGSEAKAVFAGMGVAAAFKFIIDGLKMVPEVISIPLKALKTEFTTEIYPAVVAVGYICGYKISSFLFAGGLLAWFVMIPAIAVFGGNTVLFPANCSVAELYAAGGASAIWSNFVRYIGAGALAAAGIISLIKSLPLICKTFASAMKGLKNSTGVNSDDRTSKDLSIKFVLIGVLVVVLAIWLLPPIQAGLVSALLIVLFGFFFATVSSKMVGLVGSSNNPVSGMAIATLLIATILLKITGDTGSHGMVSAITIGSIICIIAAIAGDTSQDLKTGYLLGATPKKQQIGELIGAVISALTIGGVLILLNTAWGFGSKELSAPQATLMKLVTEGVMNGNLPWNFVFIGAACTVIFEILGMPSLAVAIGIYLPLELTAPIMIGGVLRKIMDKKNNSSSSESSRGVLFSSGLIAGEGLLGVLLAILTVAGVADKIAFGAAIPNVVRVIGSVVVFALLLVLMVKYALPGKNEKAK